MRRALVFATDQLEPLPELARRAEAAGFDRLWTTEYRGRDAVARAIAVALATERIEVGTGIAYAFTRPPLAMAALAGDAQRLARGRFGLGLSAGTKGIRRQYGVADWDRPAPALAEYVAGLRAAFAEDPMLGAPPPIYGAAMNAAMARSVAATCDGALLHAIALTRVHLHERLVPALREGAARRADIEPRDVADLRGAANPFRAATADADPAPPCDPARPLELAAWCVTAVDKDADAARERARVQLAFYLATPSFAPVTAGAAWEDAAAAVRAAFAASGRRAPWRDLAHHVPDAAVDELAIWGTPAEAGRKAAALEAELAPLGVGELVFQPCGAEADAAALVAECEKILTLPTGATRPSG
jgi:alkanesulfonate monooxygenase SsuD/methylene tetrahydromethanopterin reductase-like flavin-dependent oxidoreductase (luciferase family)